MSVWLWQEEDIILLTVTNAVAAQARSTMQSLENGFIGLKFQCFQPSEDGSIS